MRALNKRDRKKDKPTNVLSYPSGERAFLGDIVLARQTVWREAREQKKSPADHVTHLVVHGTLHLLGHDHETSDADAERMEALERRILKRLGIADPYACDVRARHSSGVHSAASGGSVQSISSGCLPFGGGKARSSSARTCGESFTSSAPRFSFTRSRDDDFGMVTTPGWASSQAIASWAGVQPMPSASFLSAALREQPALVERRIGHQRDRALAHPRQQVELGAAARQAVEHLVAGVETLVEAGGVFHVVEVEVADAEVADLSCVAQAVERLEGFLEPGAAAPVQQVEIDALDAAAA